jgi:hypothetical protein
LSENNDALFREVDEEVRQEEFMKLWGRYGRHMVVAACVLVGGVAAWEGWKYYQQQQAEAAGSVYFSALQKAGEGKFDDASAALAAVNHKGYGALAKLEQAAVLAGKGDTEKAVAAYDAFAADASNDPALADLARIRAGYLLVDSQTPDQLLTRLGPFDKDSALWRNEAREIFGLSAWRVKDYAMAARYFNAIALDPKATQGLRQRAQMMLQLAAPFLPQK